MDLKNAQWEVITYRDWYVIRVTYKNWLGRTTHRYNGYQGDDLTDTARFTKNFKRWIMLDAHRRPEAGYHSLEHAVKDLKRAYERYTNPKAFGDCRVVYTHQVADTMSELDTSRLLKEMIAADREGNEDDALDRLNRLLTAYKPKLK
jgi:hypothetical protein